MRGRLGGGDGKKEWQRLLLLGLGFFVDHGVEAVAGEEAYAFVEFYGLLVGFGDCEGEGAEA